MRVFRRLLYVLLGGGVVALAAYIGHAWWQDLDSPETLEHARKLVAAQSAL